MAVDRCFALADRPAAVRYARAEIGRTMAGDADAAHVDLIIEAGAVGICPIGSDCADPPRRCV